MTKINDGVLVKMANTICQRLVRVEGFTADGRAVCFPFDDMDARVEEFPGEWPVVGLWSEVEKVEKPFFRGCKPIVTKQWECELFDNPQLTTKATNFRSPT